MNPNDEKIRAAIAEQAGDWFVGNDEGSHDVRESADLAAWLRTSPVHIEEFLGVSVIARDLREARTHPEYSLEAILARARAEDEPGVHLLRQPPGDAVRVGAPRRWRTATVAMAMAMAIAACLLLSIGLFLTWSGGPNRHSAASDGMTALHFETRHGEQLTRRFADDSVLHLNTDSAITIRYGKNERVAVLTSGEADFEVAHDPKRTFRVLAGSVVVSDLGTTFDVRLARDSTVVTVVEGEVAVRPSTIGPRLEGPSRADVQLGANQQLIIANGVWPPAKAVAVDAQRATAWLHHQIAFDHESLEKVAAEYNRYASKPIEIVTPGLQKLEISGVFATDDPAEFIAFLRSMEGVKVEETATRFRVSRDHR
jgi:transmembrane sensor